jgi:hypothetical protein
MAAELVDFCCFQRNLLAETKYFFLSRPGCKPGLWKVDQWSTQGKERINPFGSIERGALEDPNFQREIQREILSASRAVGCHVAGCQKTVSFDPLRANRTEPHKCRRKFTGLLYSNGQIA